MVRLAILATTLWIAIATVVAGEPGHPHLGAAQRSLTFDERVAAQRAIEGVYWRHRIWPEGNPTPKPSLDDVMPASTVRRKVEDYLRKSNALEKFWGTPITAAELQAEINRMVVDTRSPDVLGEIFGVPLGSAPRATIDPDVVLRDGLAAVRDMSRLVDAASLEERKELIHAFVSGVTVHPDEARVDVMVSQLPVLTANSSVGLVAGARYEPLQIDLRPLDRFLAGLKRAA